MEFSFSFIIVKHIFELLDTKKQCGVSFYHFIDCVLIRWRRRLSEALEANFSSGPGGIFIAGHKIKNRNETVFTKSPVSGTEIN